MYCECNCCCKLIELKLNAILELLISLHTGKAIDLEIVFGLKSSTMKERGGVSMSTNKKATGPAIKHPCLAPKGAAGKSMAMPDVTLTDPAPKSIMLQPIDASGNPVTIQPTDTVAGTLTSSSASLAVAQTSPTDSTKFTGTIPANTPFGSTADLTATLTGTIQGAAANLTASVHVIINIPPSPVAVDMQIIFA